MPLLDLGSKILDWLIDPAAIMAFLTVSIGLLGLAALILLYPLAREE
jgi:hypothetical protein